MEYKWIQAKGTCTSEEIMSLIGQYIGTDYIYLASFSDAYVSGNHDLNDLMANKGRMLLELRVFTEKAEILFTRSFLKSEFQWRLTCDEQLEHSDYIDTEQYIDINDTKSIEKDGMMQLYTTVGGTYSLPITSSQNAVRIRTYVIYDSNGMAAAADYRVCGFCRK